MFTPDGTLISASAAPHCGGQTDRQTDRQKETERDREREREQVCLIIQIFHTSQVGDANLDHQYWGRPEEMTMPRTCVRIGPSRPGSDVAGETGAALAAGAIVFKEKGGKGQRSLASA